MKLQLISYMSYTDTCRTLITVLLHQCSHFVRFLVQIIWNSVVHVCVQINPLLGGDNDT